jgi:hypothetical protein
MEFFETVDKHFLFLKNAYQFKSIIISDSYIRYESESVFVNIQIDSHRTCEISISLGELNKLYDGAERPFSLAEVINLQKLDETTYLKATNSIALESSIEKLALLLAEHCKEYLKNSELAFKRLSKFRDSQCLAYEEEAYLEQQRRQALFAWKNKNFHDVVKAYLSIKKHLSQGELKKLSYARKQV